MMTFLNMCEILLCIMLYIIYLHSAIILLVVAIYISVPVCTICGRGQDMDEKYDQCILYLPLDLVIYWVVSQVS